MCAPHQCGMVMIFFCFVSALWDDPHALRCPASGTTSLPLRLPGWPECGRVRANSDRDRVTLGRFPANFGPDVGPTSVDVGPKLICFGTSLADSVPALVDPGPIFTVVDSSPMFGRYRAKFARCRATIGRIRADFGRACAKCGRILPISGRCWSIEFWSNSTKHWSTPIPGRLDRSQSTVSQIWPHLARLRPTSAISTGLGPMCAKLVQHPKNVHGPRSGTVLEQRSLRKVAEHSQNLDETRLDFAEHYQHPIVASRDAVETFRVSFEPHSSLVEPNLHVAASDPNLLERAPNLVEPSAHEIGAPPSLCNPEQWRLTGTIGDV